MKIEPVITEKSLKDAGRGKYTFIVEPAATKHEIKEVVNELFDVNVISVKTMNNPALTRKNYMGRKIKETAKKKAIVTLKKDEKIDIFEEEAK